MIREEHPSIAEPELPRAEDNQPELLAPPSKADVASPDFTPFIHPTDKDPSVGTPFMRQWTAAKRENPEALLFFRMGDFYELFYDDAVTASRELQLTLTARDRERQVPMCGVPYHAVESYLTRLLRRGFRIAICEQMEDPKLTKKIVKREVIRVLSPGTAIDAALGQEQNNFLAAYFDTQAQLGGKTKDAGRMWYPDRATGHPQRISAIALLDISTGEFRTAEFSGGNAGAQAADAILMAGASEVLLPTSADVPVGLERVAARTRVEDWVWTDRKSVV